MIGTRSEAKSSRQSGGETEGMRTGAEEAAVEGGLAEGAADGGDAEDGLDRRGFHARTDWRRVAAGTEGKPSQ
jgi:hypothetical protein